MRKNLSSQKELDNHFKSMPQLIFFSIIGFAIILMGKRELVALLNLSSWCLVKVERLFLAVQRGCLRFVIVVFPDHTHLLFLLPTPFLFIWVLQIFNEYSIFLRNVDWVFCFFQLGIFVIEYVIFLIIDSKAKGPTSASYFRFKLVFNVINLNY